MEYARDWWRGIGSRAKLLALFLCLIAAVLYANAVVNGWLSGMNLGGLMAFLLVVVGFVLCGFLIIRILTRPIARLRQVIESFEGGDYSIAVPEEYLSRRDEIGAISQLLAEQQRRHEEEARLLEVTSAIASEIHLERLLRRVISAATELLDAERSSLFLYDPKTDELWTRVAEGLTSSEIRISPSQGIAGATFSTGKTLSVADVRADPRFAAELGDAVTGYDTRSLLSMPIILKDGRRIGVTQVLNKRSGEFDEHDARRLKSLTAQVAAALENARLFEDVLNVRDFNENILRSLGNGVLTVDCNSVVTKMNQAAARILKLDETTIIGRPLESVFDGANGWIVESERKVLKSGEGDVTLDTDIERADGAMVSVNLTAIALRTIDQTAIGVMLVFEDISGEKRVRGTMARYLPKEVVDHVLEQGDALLGGKSQEVSVLFSDIRGFTTIAEQLGPKETVVMLNEYFTEMVEIIDSHSGILDKYMGDAIMAIFGAPFVSAEDADNAVAAAIGTVTALERFNVERAGRGHAAIMSGIGVSTGEVIAGNIGSPKRLEYTVIGDPVNLAARLESATKYYGVPILLSETTYRALRGKVPCREIDFLRVKGKTQPVAIYAPLLAPKSPGLCDPETLADCYARGLSAYRRRNWQEADDCFSRALDLSPEDRPSVLFRTRNRHCSENAPPEDWDGCWDMETK